MGIGFFKGVCVSMFNPQGKPLRTRSHVLCVLYRARVALHFPAARPQKGLKEPKEADPPKTASFFNLGV